MARDISNRDDIIDSRDIVARVEELEGERAAIPEDDAAGADEWDDDNGEELKTLRELVEEINNYAGDNADDGVTLIRADYFEQYARELADDLGLMKAKEEWPYTCIDWEQAANELLQDYTSVSWGGVDYWLR